MQNKGVHTEVTIAGFGGQGIMLAGKLLALAGLEEGREVVWMPSYGPEMRGGTAYCNVVVSDKAIGSPIFANPNTALIMNKPSLLKFGPQVKSGGQLIINDSLIDEEFKRDDIEIFNVSCNDLAVDAGSTKAANMVALGAYVNMTAVVNIETVISLIKKTFEKKPKLIDINITAFESGVMAINKQKVGLLDRCLD